MNPIERFKGPGGRHYQLWVQRDLFGGLVVLRAWGGEKSGRGGLKSPSLASEVDFAKILRRIRNCRRQHEYVSVWISVNCLWSAKENRVRYKDRISEENELTWSEQ